MRTKSQVIRETANALDIPLVDIPLSRSTAEAAMNQAEERDENERIQAMIAFYDSMDELALNDYFLSKGEWL